MPRSVKGKSAIVTGGGSGINLEFVRILLQNGCNVVIGDLTLRPEAEELIKEHTGNPKALFHKTNVASWDNLYTLFKTAETEFGTFDIVCPGAGIFEPPFSGFWNPPGSEASRDDIHGDRFLSIDVNLVHSIRATQLAISHFLSSSKPASKDDLKTVVHISSIAGEGNFTPVAIYSTTKWGLRGFIYSMAEIEETRHVRVAGVAPRVVRTPLWLEHDDKRRMCVGEDEKEQGEWTTPEEVAQVMYKICTEDQVANAKGELVPIRGGSLIEVINGDVRDVPMYGNQPPGTGTDAKGLFILNPMEAWKGMNAAVEKPGWGKV
ncbi:hypothetical protein PMZ80_002616 [Knufia obscura]|uniref:Uncharacterized protein n=1 Tax=Knufia obscura TaxID=1635080 RepID=A0ABR0RXU2_9EURO|nr:hypothetical protein PMZ80_002616 [Knufia obscura]